MRKQMDPQVDYLNKLGYEARDVSLVTLSKWGIGLLVFLAAMTAVAWLVYKLFVPDYAERAAEGGPARVRHLPASPQLQVHPKADMGEYRLSEERAVNTYHWIGKPGGRIGIPIDKAIDRAAQSATFTGGGAGRSVGAIAPVAPGGMSAATGAAVPLTPGGEKPADIGAARTESAAGRAMYGESR